MKTEKANSFQGLQLVLSDYSESGTVKKIGLLEKCSQGTIGSPKSVQQYHNTLLFLLSYADNITVYELANREMKRLTDLLKIKPAIRETLTGSGIAGTLTQAAFSLTLTKWLLKEFPGTVSLHSFDKSGIHPKEILKHALPEAEFELLSDEKLNALKWLEKASGTKNKQKILLWLTGIMDSINASDHLKDQLFESLKLFVEINPDEETFSRSYGKTHLYKQFFHSDGIVKKFDERALINKPLPAEKRLSEKEKREVIKASRIALCLLNRETDPITYSENLNIKYYELERGLTIALFSIDKERRLPLESYIGFMMFKNGYPMSYGGAWLFGKRSLIGINIFEAFRGGESAIVFAQLLRCYRMAFGATYFEVEPYQFGKDNPEGIQSGAFWFYYRFGFRPCDKALRELSLSESKKIVGTKGYRSPVEVLKKFTASNLFVHFDNSTVKPLNPADLSRHVTQKITADFKGDRVAASKHCLQLLKKNKIISGEENKTGLNKMFLFFGFCFKLETLSAKQRGQIQKMINAKAASEFEYIELMNSFNLEKHLLAEVKQFLS